MKQFYIIISTICAFEAMDFIYSGEFSPSCCGEGHGTKTEVFQS
jgi:hypothetical protein